MEEVFLSFGTNMGDKAANLKAAISLVSSEIGLITKQSSIYQSESWGFEGETFENMICKLYTELLPLDLISKVLGIEETIGRVRGENIDGYSNRLIDIDIISYGNWIVKSADLIIPHPAMHKRNFVLEPLVEIDPNWLHPVKMLKAKQLLENSKDQIRAEWLR